MIRLNANVNSGSFTHGSTTQFHVQGAGRAGAHGGGLSVSPGPEGEAPDLTGDLGSMLDTAHASNALRGLGGGKPGRGDEETDGEDPIASRPLNSHIFHSATASGRPDQSEPETGQSTVPGRVSEAAELEV
jgi:hypothetical protein